MIKIHLKETGQKWPVNSYESKRFMDGGPGKLDRSTKIDGSNKTTPESRLSENSKLPKSTIKFESMDRSV